MSTCKERSKCWLTAGPDECGVPRWLARTLRSSVGLGHACSAPRRRRRHAAWMAILACSVTGKLFSRPPAPPVLAVASRRSPASAATPPGPVVPAGGWRCGPREHNSGAAASGRPARRELRLARRLQAAPAKPEATKRKPDRCPGFLGRSRVTALTRGRYEQAYARFVLAEGKRFDLVASPRLVDLRDFDAALERHIEREFDAGAHKADVNYLIAAVVHLACWPRREFGTRCPRATAAAAGWSKLEPDRSKDPCPWILGVLLARWLCASGLAFALDAARCLLLQFAFYLRPAECLRLLVSACFGGEGGRGKYNRCAVMIAPSSTDDCAGARSLGTARLPVVQPSVPRATKTGTFDDTVVLDDALVDPRLKDVFLATLRDARAGGHQRLLRGLTYRVYFKLLTTAASALKFKFRITPHMFRHGAASEDFFRKLRDLPAIQQRGRWRSLSSVQRYQKSGRLLAVLRRCDQVLLDDALAADNEHLAFAL